MQKRQIKIHIAVGFDKEMFAGGFGGFGVAGVNHNYPAAAIFDCVDVLAWVRNLQKAPLRHHRVGANNDKAVGVDQIGKRQRKRKAVHTVRHCKLVGAILGSGGEHIARTHRVHEALGKYGVQYAEAGGGANVHGDGVAAVIGL